MIHVNNEGSNQHALNVPNRDAIKAKTSSGIGDKKVSMTLFML